MTRNLQDKLAMLGPARRAWIEAEAARLHEEYLNMQQPPGQQHEERNDAPSKRR